MSSFYCPPREGGIPRFPASGSPSPWRHYLIHLALFALLLAGLASPTSAATPADVNWT